MSEDNVDSNGYPRPKILGPSVHDFETSVKSAKVCPDVPPKNHKNVTTLSSFDPGFRFLLQKWYWGRFPSRRRVALDTPANFPILQQLPLSHKSPGGGV